MKPKLTGHYLQVAGIPLWIWRVSWWTIRRGLPVKRTRNFFTWDAALDFANEVADDQAHRPHLTRWELTV